MACHDIDRGQQLAPFHGRGAPQRVFASEDALHVSVNRDVERQWAGGSVMYSHLQSSRLQCRAACARHASPALSSICIPHAALGLASHMALGTFTNAVTHSGTTSRPTHLETGSIACACTHPPDRNATEGTSILGDSASERCVRAHGSVFAIGLCTIFGCPPQTDASACQTSFEQRTTVDVESNDRNACRENVLLASATALLPELALRRFGRRTALAKSKHEE